MNINSVIIRAVLKWQLNFATNQVIEEHAPGIIFLPTGKSSGDGRDREGTVFINYKFWKEDNVEPLLQIEKTGIRFHDITRNLKEYIDSAFVPVSGTRFYKKVRVYQLKYKPVLSRKKQS